MVCRQRNKINISLVPDKICKEVLPANSSFFHIPPESAFDRCEKLHIILSKLRCHVAGDKDKSSSPVGIKKVQEIS